MANIVVSACLLGLKCRYSGEVKTCQSVIALAREHTLIPVCPEQLGGLPTPREPAEQKGGRVFTKSGADMTDAFCEGAQAVLRVARICAAHTAVLKARSPSCGAGCVYDGTFTGTRVPGDGVCAALLKQNGVRVLTEEDVERGTEIHTLRRKEI